MLRDCAPIGVIEVARAEPGPFSDSEIELLKTFADQAVIATENVRLFSELEGRNRDLTATAGILRVISSSPTEVQPTFDTIVRSAVALCGGLFSALFQFDGELLHLVSHHNFTAEALEAAHGVYPTRPSRGQGSTRAILERAVVHIPDVEVDAEYQTRGVARVIGWRSGLFVPMLREGTPIGVIMVARAEAGAFSDNEIDLLKTFADQAVIAIENVRLFSELTTALDQQTVTSDILRVISQSQTDVRPVFDAIVTSAVRLLRAHSGSLTRLVGDQIELAALTSTDNAGDANLRETFPRSLHAAGSIAHAIRDRAPLNVTDTEVDPRRPEAFRAMARARGYRSQVVVPLLRHGEAIGAIAVTRREPGGFTDDEIALLRTFADQAVIAIENARLLTELQARTQELSRSVGELQALGEVGQAISSTLDLETVLTTIVARAVQLSALDGGVVFEYDEGTEEFVHRAATETGGTLAEARRTTRVQKGEGVVGQTALTLEPAQVPDITVPGAYDSRLRGNLIESGVRAILAVPMVREGHIIGCLVVSRNRPGEFPAETIDLLRTFATQSALAIQNARLFQEIADKSRQLEAASRHKSEFLANMSHELRTPLNAIIGFSEVLMQRMFGELNAKQDEYLKDIYDSGRHLLSLINDILDLSKIEAGRMELELTDFDLPTAIDTALTLVRERATRRGIALQKTLDERIGSVQADERKVRQVVMNLLSNAIKFTPEGGRIQVRAMPVDGSVEVSVTDTGVGIAPEDQEAVFEEFRQVGASAAKQEGTGLGLALCRKFVELHGGTIWVTSAVGAGSTFTFRLPVRPWPAR
jgi:two-component system, NtrC family, sensor kinase